MGNSSGNEGKREMEGREIERTWKLKKNSGREYLEYVGGRGSVFIVTVFRVLNVGEVECLKLKLGCIGVKIEKRILVGNKWDRWESWVMVYCVEVLCRCIGSRIC